jgi:crotonobetainyl-CoA:carnitine CoA-transferase CaiB-like acyl-CoA transferase
MSETFAEGTAKAPLNRVRILDLSRPVVGIADIAADVIKVEPPEGDLLRAWKLKNVAVKWKVYALNKRSIALDLRATTTAARFLISSRQPTSWLGTFDRGARPAQL